MTAQLAPDETTDATTAAAPGAPPTAAPADEARAPRAAAWLRSAGRAALAVGGALVIFGVFMAAKGVSPLTAYSEMFGSVLSSPKNIGEIFIRAAPIMLAALAVTVPARAGLINVGGEGQLVIGGVAAAGVSLGLTDRVSGTVVLILMFVAARRYLGW